MAGPLEGIKVVELGVWVAGPAAGGILADWGADVVKIEPPTGDPARMFGRMLGLEGDESPPFEMDNRGKRSIVLDLTTDDGRFTALELLGGADVFITNVRPGALRRIGLDFETVAAAQSASGVRPDHRLRRRGTRCRPRGLRRRRVLGPRGPGAPADPPGRHPAVSAGRHGRPHGGHDAGGGGVCRAGRQGAHRQSASWCRRRCTGRVPTPSASTSTRSC